MTKKARADEVKGADPERNEREDREQLGVVLAFLVGALDEPPGSEHEREEQHPDDQPDDASTGFLFGGSTAHTHASCVCRATEDALLARRDAEAFVTLR
jgi:hypothetical protein